MVKATTNKSAPLEKAAPAKGFLELLYSKETILNACSYFW